MDDKWQGIHICESWQDTDPNENKAEINFNASFWKSCPKNNDAIEVNLIGQDLNIEICNYPRFDHFESIIGKFTIPNENKNLKIKLSKKNHELMMIAFPVS